MTSERFEAYKRALDQIDRLGPAKLHDDEEMQLRDAAEGLLLCSEPASADAQQYREAAKQLLDRLVDSGRWLDSMAQRLNSDIHACCPEPVAV